MELNFDRLRFVILPGRDPDPTFMPLYQEAYSCWYSVWKNTYKELNVPKQMFSDDFTRQTEICSIFHENKCLAMVFIRWIDMRIETSKHDSYFKVWSEKDLTKVIRDGSNILIYSNLTLSPDCRKNNCNMSIKDLLFFLTFNLRFSHSKADGICAVARRAKRVHELCYRYGAIPLSTDVAHFDETDRVDFVAFYKSNVKNGPLDDVVTLGRKLWSERLEVKRIIYELPTQDFPLKRVA